MTSTTYGPVALLNASYEHLGHVDFKHAVRMIWRQVVVVEDAVEGRMIGPHPWPRVVRLIRYVATKWMYRPAAWSREALLARDGHRCAFCGRRADTIDHLVPQSRGGRDEWLNTVAACGSCNGKKADRTPAQAGMKLLVEPYHPTRAQVAAWGR